MLASAYPLPPYQTATQRQVFGSKSKIAAAASSNATQELLRHLDSSTSRYFLETECPSLANSSAETILGRLLSEIRVSELVESVGGGQYETVSQLPTTEFLPNIWEALFLNITHDPKHKGCGDPGAEDKNEVKVFGLPPFSTGCPPKNYSETVNRLNYVSLNFAKAPMGYSFFPVSLVFNRSYVHDQVLIAPIDTGHWNRCLGNPTSNTTLNCSGWYPTNLGNLDHMDHLFTAAYYLQKGPTR